MKNIFIIITIFCFVHVGAMELEQFNKDNDYINGLLMFESMPKDSQCLVSRLSRNTYGIQLTLDERRIREEKFSWFTKGYDAFPGYKSEVYYDIFSWSFGDNEFQKNEDEYLNQIIFNLWNEKRRKLCTTMKTFKRNYDVLWAKHKEYSDLLLCKVIGKIEFPLAKHIWCKNILFQQVCLENTIQYKILKSSALGSVEF